MNTRKLLCLSIALLMLVSAFSACGTNSSGDPPRTQDDAAGQPGEPAAPSDIFNPTGFPIVNESITLTVFGSRDENHASWNDVYVLQKYEEMTNIHMEYQEVPSQGFDEKKNLMFASNDLPDILLRSDLKNHEISLYGPTSGQLVPIGDLVEQYGENLRSIFNENPLIKSALIASDGNMYAIPQMNFSDSGRMDYKQWINREWLEAVGKDVPTTPGEFKDVLIAFRDGDPNGNGIADEIPLGIRDPDSIYALGGSFGLEYQMREPCNIDDSGQIHYWLTDDRYKEYLTFLNELYEEKLLWQEYYKNDRAPWRSNLANALFGAFYMPYTDVFLDVEDQFIGYDPLVGPHGDQIWSDAFSGITNIGAFAVTNKCEYPEAAIRWVDYFYGEEGGLFFAYGVEGETYYLDENQQPQFNDDILNDEAGFMTALGRINLVPGGKFPFLTTNVTDGTIATDLTRSVAADLAKYLPDRVYEKPTIGEEDIDRANAIIQDLENYRNEAATNFILGEWSLADNWDNYCNTMEQIGLFELEAIYQRALDAQLAA